MTLTKEQKREIERRIENWGQWRRVGNVGPRGVTGAPFPAYNLVNEASTRDLDRTNNLVVISGEAEDTDRLLRRMHPELKQALLVHCFSRALPRDRARQCKLRSVATYYRRVEKAESVFNRLCYPRQRDEFQRQSLAMP